MHQKLVSKETFLKGRATTVCCALGDTVLYPLARVHMEVEGKPIEVEAALSDRLPVGVLLGTDVSQLPELLTQQNSGVGEPEKAMVIMTRATVQIQKEQKAEEKQLEEKSGVSLSQLMNEEQRTEAKENDCDKEEEDKSEHEEEDKNEETDWMMMTDDDLFEKSREKRRLSRNMKRANKKQYNRSGGSCDNHIRGIDSKGLKMLQKADPSLESVRNKACADHATDSGTLSTAGHVDHARRLLNIINQHHSFPSLLLILHLRELRWILSDLFPAVGHKNDTFWYILVESSYQGRKLTPP